MNSSIQKILLLLSLFTGASWVSATDLKTTTNPDCRSAFLSRENNPEVVPVTVLSSEWPYIRTGTGFFINDSQTLATPLHLAFPLIQSKHLEYVFEDPHTGETVPLQPFAADLKSDLMLLKPPDSYQSDSFYPLEQLIDTKEIKDSKGFITAGFSGLLERQWSFVQGIISSYRDNNSQYSFAVTFEDKMMTVEDAHQKLSSGSPVFLEDNSLMGMLVQGGNENIVLITPAENLKNLIVQSDPSSCKSTVCVNEWEKWKERALSGDKEAQFLLGQEAFFSGEHISGEYERAIPWLENSAEQGYIPALILLGNIFLHGGGVNKNLSMAKKYFRQAADKGDAIAQYNLGMIAVEEGDPEAIVKWLFESSRQGFPLSDYYLGIMHFSGYEVERDFVAAEHYLFKAAQHGFTPAKLTLGYLYFNLGEFIKAKHWYLKVKHLPEVQYTIGIMFADGLGVEKNLQEANSWYQKAADGGEPGAQMQIGLSYIMGIGRKKDIEKGIFYLTQSAEQGIVPATHNLGSFTYQRGDLNQAMHWFSKAAHAGNPISQRHVGDMYRIGEGVSKDSKLAEQWLLESAHRGYAPAMHDLSEMYKTGEGSVLRNLKKATYWLKESQKQGYTPEDPRWHGGGEKVNETADTELIPVSHL